MDQPRHWWSGWRLTRAGWALGVALVVLVILALVDPSKGVYAGLTFVILAWAWLLGSSFPSSEVRGMSRSDVTRSDLGARTVDEYDRKHGIRR